MPPGDNDPGGSEGWMDDVDELNMFKDCMDALTSLRFSDPFDAGAAFGHHAHTAWALLRFSRVCDAFP